MQREINFQLSTRRQRERKRERERERGSVISLFSNRENRRRNKIRKKCRSVRKAKGIINAIDVNVTTMSAENIIANITTAVN